MKIVIATPLYPPDLGGPAKYAFELAREFHAQGHSVSVVRFGALERLLPIGLRHLIYFCKLLPHAWGAQGIVALDTWSVGIPALMVSKLFGKKLLVRVGGDFLWESYVERTGNLIRFSDFYAAMPSLNLKERLIRSLTGTLVRKADVLAFNGNFQRTRWQQYYFIPAHKAYVVENAFPQKQPAKPAEGLVFVAAGRSLKLKNMKVLQEAFAEVAKTHPDMVLDTRPLPREQHVARLARAYATVVPSLSEMSPNVLVEGVAVGKPFIATEDSGALERLEGLGLFIDTRSKAAWREAFKTLLQPEEYAHYTGRVAQFSYMHSMADVAREYISLLN